MRFTDAEYVSVFKSLSDETRIRIVRCHCKEEMCEGSLLKHFNITQPTLSYHIRILTDCGLVNARREGTWMFYSINPERGAMVKCFLDDVAADEAQAGENS